MPDTPILSTRVHSRVPFDFLLLLPASASQPGNFALLSSVPKPSLLGTPSKGTQQTAEGLCHPVLISPILPRKQVPVLGWSPQQPGWAEVPLSSTPSSYLKGTGAVPMEEDFFRVEVGSYPGCKERLAFHSLHCLPLSPHNSHTHSLRTAA